MNLEEAIKLLSNKVDEAEIYYSTASSNTIQLKKGEIDLYKDSAYSGYGVRIIQDKHMGFSFGNKLDEKLIDTALSVAKVSEEDPHLSLPSISNNYRDVDVYDSGLAELDSEDASALALDLIKPCDEIGVMASSAAFSWETSRVEIMNSHGIHDSEKETACFAYVSAVANNGEASSGSYFDSSIRLDLDMDKIGRKAADLAKSSLGAKGIGNLKTNVILRPNAVADLVGYTLIPAFTADNVQRNRSPLAGRLGEKLFGEIDIIDDGLLKDGLGSSRFDGEGVASQKTVLVDNGVLKGFLFDTYTGVKGGEESTGNAD
ncbi:MAG: TldD/PmbA family protein, partial [Candidatus Binatia bacterium]